MDLGLNGKTVLVTGAGKGIGQAIAHRLSAEGCHLVLVSRTAADLDSLAAELTKRHSGRVATSVIDFPDAQAISKLARDYPDIDIVVNNAGAIPGGTIQSIDSQRWRQSWDGKIFGYIGVM